MNDISQFIINNETELRLGFFVCLLSLFLLLEYCFPRKQLQLNSLRRKSINLGFTVFNTIFLRLTLPFAATATALLVEQYQFGLFHQLTLPDSIEFIACLLMMDLVIYWQHRLFHRIPVLWRLHSMHHTDLEIDTTTAVRFHPLEILISMLIKMATVALLGIPLIAVIIFEILLSACALFNHSNLDIPVNLDKFLRGFVVTPDMHRIHHSQIVKETNSNYGFNISLWDRIFSSYTKEPALGQLHIRTGLEQYNNEQALGFVKLLKLPFSYRNSG